MAAASIANIVKSSLGPVGLDKMLVDDIGVCTALNPNQVNLESVIRYCNQTNWTPTFCACHGVMAGRDHHQRWSHHPQATGGGAPGCQGPLWVGGSSGQGGRRWDHVCGKRDFLAAASLWRHTRCPVLVPCVCTCSQTRGYANRRE